MVGGHIRRPKTTEKHYVGKRQPSPPEDLLRSEVLPLEAHIFFFPQNNCNLLFSSLFCSSQQSSFHYLENPWRNVSVLSNPCKRNEIGKVSRPHQERKWISFSIYWFLLVPKMGMYYQTAFLHGQSALNRLKLKYIYWWNDSIIRVKYQSCFQWSKM